MSAPPYVWEGVRYFPFSLFLRWAGWDDDVGQAPEREATVLKRMLPSNNMALRQSSQGEGISEATLHNWQADARGRGQRLPNADAGPEDWSSRGTFAVVLQTAALNKADLAEDCRKRGHWPTPIATWRSACERANAWDHASTTRLGQATKTLKKRVQGLKWELERTEKALAKATALLFFSNKSFSDLGGMRLGLARADDKA